MRKIDDLLAYLNALTKLHTSGEYLCSREIDECIALIVAELEVGEDISLT